MTTEKKQIRRLILITSGAMVLFLLISLFFMTAITSNQTNHTRRYLDEIAVQVKNNVAIQINGDLQTLHGMTAFAGQSETIDIDWLLSVLEQESRYTSFQQVGFVDLNGLCYLTDKDGNQYKKVDLSDREYIRQALQGNPCASGILENRLGDGKVTCYSVPIYFKEEIIGALCATNDAYIFQELLAAPFFNGSGYSQIVDNHGSLVIHAGNQNKNNKLKNIFDADFLNTNNKTILRSGLQNGESGSFSFSINGVAYWGTFVPVGVNNWSIISIVTQSAIDSDLNHLFLVSWITVITVIIMLIAMFLFVNAIIKKNREEITKMAYFDSLTGAHNRAKFMVDSLLLLNNSDQQYAVISFDIRNFKFLNELFGYGAGDLFIKHIARVLSMNIQPDELFFRDMGDRFGMLMKCFDLDALGSRLDAIMEQVSAYRFQDRHKYNIVCNCGIKTIDAYIGQGDMDLYIDRALLALAKAKKIFANGYAIYDEELHAAANLKNLIESGMRSALETNAFVVYLQGKVSLTTKKIIGAEALVRWNTVNHGMVAPNVFIPVFEQNGFIIQLDLYVLRKTCSLLRRWIDAGYPVFPLSVNQSRLIFYKEDYLESIEQIVTEFNISHSLIILEITENIALEDMGVIRTLLTRLRKLGFCVSMDDFGSGYSSLNLLQNIPIDELKLDRVFFSGTEHNCIKKSIIKKIVELSKELNITTVAEGVETAEQVLFLQKIGCDIAQGYYFAKPMPDTEFEALAFGTNPADDLSKDP